MARNDDPDDPPGFSRRTFLRGSAGGAALTCLITLSQKARAAAPEVRGPAAVPITLRVNGAARSVKVEPRTSLVAALRGERVEDLGRSVLENFMRAFKLPEV